VRNSALEVTLPTTGFRVVSNTANTIAIADNQGLGILVFSSGPQSPAATPAQLQAQVLATLQSKYPDTKQCINTQTGALNGANGIIQGYCYTLVSQGGGQSIPAVMLVFMGATADGNTYFALLLSSTQKDFNTEFNATLSIVNSVVWLLLK